MNVDLTKEEIALVITSTLLHLETAEIAITERSASLADPVEYQKWQVAMRRIQRKLLSAKNLVPVDRSTDDEHKEGGGLSRATSEGGPTGPNPPPP